MNNIIQHVKKLYKWNSYDIRIFEAGREFVLILFQIQAVSLRKNGIENVFVKCRS